MYHTRMCGAAVSMLLFFLWSVVEVHSQTAPYVTFMGETLPNHSYVDLSLVGGANHSIQCHTDLDSCCSNTEGVHRGDWYPPGNETRLPFTGDVYEQRTSQRVDLRRRNNADMPSGIYRCDIPINAVHDENDIGVRASVYVGVHASGGEQVSEYNYTLYLLY